MAQLRPVERTSGGVQWVGILTVQGTWVQSLVWEDPTCLGATKPMPQLRQDAANEFLKTQKVFHDMYDQMDFRLCSSATEPRSPCATTGESAHRSEDPTCHSQDPTQPSKMTKY